MADNELIKSREQLEEIAEMMSQEIASQEENIVSRYIKLFSDLTTFNNGQKFESKAAGSNINKEMMDRGVFTKASIDDIWSHNYKEVSVARDIQEHRFNFEPKGIPLPTATESYSLSVPSGIDRYDAEFKDFTKDHPNTRLSRSLIVEQKIVANSQRGISIQSIPFLTIQYSGGYSPILTRREIAVVCSTEEDVARLPELIKFIADPTPEKKIRNAGSFAEAFHELHAISGLKHGSLEEAGIPMSELYDVVVLTGVPAHEVFGHHFEEPITFLGFEESGTFKYGQNITNKDLVLTDNPQQRIEGFRVQGFTHFDAYGRPREERVHIKDGKIVGFLGSEYADAEKLKQYLNLERSGFVGNAAQYNDGMFPQPRMSCTVMDGKTEKVDLEGKILVVSHEGRTEDDVKTYAIQTDECYVVRNGTPERVVPLQITGGINQALANIVLMDDQNYQSGVCSKPEPIYHPQSTSNATVPASQFARVQMWQGQQVYPRAITGRHLKSLQEKTAVE